MSFSVQLVSARRVGQIFPWDVLFIVVQYADRATLAALGSVATELLRVTAPLLYETVEITTVRQLEQLFCPRADVKVSNEGWMSRSFEQQARLRSMIVRIHLISHCPSS